MHLSLADLAKLVHMHRNTLTKRPDSPAVQKSLEPVVHILAAAAELTGNPDQAILWFLHQPIAGYDGQTAQQLVQNGHADAVLAHLDDLRNGVYG